MDFSTIKEPKEIRDWMISLRETTFSSGEGNIDWDAYVIWAGNKFPKYFWDQWKPGLKEKGFTWQTFLKLLRYRKDHMLLWYRRELGWNDLVREIVDFMESSIGHDIAGK